MRRIIMVLMVVLSMMSGAWAVSAPVSAGSDVPCQIEGTGGPDTLSGGSGAQQICGRGGPDTLSGGSGNDDLRGGDGGDDLFGGSGADSLSGGSGDDELFGESGTDTLTGGGGADVFSGGTGFDTATDFACGVDSTDGTVEQGIPDCPPDTGGSGVIPAQCLFAEGASGSFTCSFTNGPQLFAFRTAGDCESADPTCTFQGEDYTCITRGVFNSVFIIDCFPDV